MKRKLLVLPALAGLIAPVLAGCGGSDGSGGGGDAIVIGTTDSITLSKKIPAPLDPAASYGSSSWNLFYNTFQTLLRYPRTGTTPGPEAAKSCKFTDQQSEVYRCTLRSGLTFSNGHALTAQDVKYSIDRTLKINSDLGPASLVAGVQDVEAPDDSTVVFHLKSPDATFPLKLATPAAAIVDSQDNFLQLPYHNALIKSQLLPHTRQEAQRAGTDKDFERMQDSLAADIPMIPLWQAKQYIVARDDITGAEWVLNSSSETQFWELGRGVAG